MWIDARGNHAFDAEKWRVHGDERSQSGVIQKNADAITVSRLVTVD
jgi:hypothetical protein